MREGEPTDSRGAVGAPGPSQRQLEPMIKLEKPELLDEALTLLGPLPTEHREAARVMLLSACEKLSEPQGGSYRETLEILEAAEEDVRRLRRRLRTLNPYISRRFLPTYAFFYPFSPPGWFYGSKESSNFPPFNGDRILRVLEESLHGLQGEVATWKVTGGHGSLRSRIVGPPKMGFATGCSIV